MRAHNNALYLAVASQHAVGRHEVVVVDATIVATATSVDRNLGVLLPGP